jgi:hypothetical protein
MDRIEFTLAERRTVTDAWNVYHQAVLDVLKKQNADYDDIDIIDAGKSIALEGYLDL